MTKRTYTTKSGTTFEWDETKEVLEAIKQLHDETKNDTKSKTVE